MDIRELLFKYRGYTPIPLAIMLLYQSNMRLESSIVGSTLALLGEVTRLYSVRAAGGRTRTRSVGADQLCTWGPFAYVRNPLYIGNILIYSGIILLAGGQWMFYILIIALIFFIVQYSLIVSLEEERLLYLFDEDYKKYCNAVRRFIPRFRPWREERAIRKIGWSKVLYNEKSTLMILFLFIAALILKEVLINTHHA